MAYNHARRKTFKNMNHMTFNLSLIEISEVTEAKVSRQEESFVTKAAVRVTLKVYGA